MRTRDDGPISDMDLDRLANEAEVGYDLSAWKRRRGRPSLAAFEAPGSVSPKIETRVPATLRDELQTYATAEGKTVSRVLRELAEDYVASRQAREDVKAQPARHDRRGSHGAAEGVAGRTSFKRALASMPDVATDEELRIARDFPRDVE